jgi:SAM-dependent methyltransferase
METDEIKKFWDSRPCNIKHSKLPVGTIGYFEEVDQRRYFVEPHILEFADFSAWKGKKVLEIGCGIGTDSIRFAKAGADITCLELSEKSMEICRERFKQYNLTANFYIGNAENILDIVPVQEYDLIYSFGVIHHAKNPELIIDSLKNYMSKDSVCKIMLYSKYSWKSIEFFLREGINFKFNFKNTIRYFAEAQLNCPVANVYTVKGLENLLAKYTIEKIEKSHIFKYSIPHYINYEYRVRTIFKLIPGVFYKKIEKLLGWHYLITFKL